MSKRKDSGRKVYSRKKRMKRRLEKPSRSFQALFNLIPDPAVIIDAKGEILAVNDGAERLAGLKRKEIVGKNFLKMKMLTAESASIATKNLAKRMMGSPMPPYELELYARNGEKRWGEVNSTKIEYEGKPAILVVFREITKHKRTEEELRKSEEKHKQTSVFLNSVLSNMSDYVIVLDEDYNFQFLNERAKKLYGEVVGQKCYKVVRDRDSPCYHAGIPCEVHEIIEKGKDYFEDTRLGEVTGRISQVRARPTRTAEGKKGIITVTRDVTEEKQAEEKLRESEKRYRTLFEESGYGISITTREGKFIDINQAYADLFGYTKEELLRLNVKDTYANPDDRKKLQQEMERKGSVKYYGVKRRRNDGTEIDCLVTSTPLRGEDGSILGYQTTIRDVTERRRLEGELRRSKQSLEAVIENIPDPVFIKDPDSTHTLVNQAYCEFYRRPKEEIIGKTDSELFPPEEADLYRKQDIEVIEKGIILNIPEETVTDAHGTTHIFHAKKAPLKNAEGNVTNIVSVMRDITERKWMEQELKQYTDDLEKLVDDRTLELRKSEQKYHMLIDNMTDVVFTIDLKGNYTFASPAAERLTGYPVQKLLTMNMKELIAPEYLPAIQDRLQKRIQGAKELPAYEFEIIKADGKRLQIEMSTTPILSEDDRATGIQGIVRDVSMRRQAEMKLRESEAFSSGLLANSPTPILVLNGDKSIRYVNPAFEELTGYSSSELIGMKPPYPWWPKEQIVEIDKDLDEFMHSGYVRHERCFQKKNGELMWVEVHNTSIRSNGSLKHFLGIWTDITQRKKIEESLRESEKKHKETSTLLSSILSQMSDYIFLIDEDYTTRFINKATREVYGAAEGEKCYKAFRKLDRPCYHADVLCEVHELLHKSKDYFEDIRQTGPKITHLRSTPTVTSDGKRAVLTVSRDVTEQKKAEEKLRQMERLATIGETAAMVGHDIRNPLQGIAGAAHYLKHHTDTERNVKAKEMLEIIDQSITNADKIVNDLLDYAREIWLESIDANLQRLIRAALDLARVPENIQVTDLTESSLRITVDPEKIRRLFVNLIKNAVDAMPEGGKLTITSKESNGNIEISITDTGAGMTKETMEKLWTPLFTTKPRGMGFGLAICKRIAEAHGGTITAESRVNEGSTLTVKLPLQQRKTEES